MTKEEIANKINEIEYEVEDLVIAIKVIRRLTKEILESLNEDKNFEE